MTLDHTTAQQWLLRRQDGALTADQEAALATHLAACASCRAEAQAFEQWQRRLNSGLRTRYPAAVSAETQRNKEQLKARLSRRRPIHVGPAPAFAVGLVALIGLMVVLVRVPFSAELAPAITIQTTSSIQAPEATESATATPEPTVPATATQLATATQVATATPPPTETAQPTQAATNQVVAQAVAETVTDAPTITASPQATDMPPATQAVVVTTVPVPLATSTPAPTATELPVIVETPTVEPTVSVFVNEPPVIGHLVQTLNGGSAETLANQFIDGATYGARGIGYRELAIAELVSEFKLFQRYNTRFTIANCTEHPIGDTESQLTCTITMRNRWRDALGFGLYEGLLILQYDTFSKKITEYIDFQYGEPAAQEQTTLNRFIAWHNAQSDGPKLMIYKDASSRIVRSDDLFNSLSTWNDLGQP